MAIAVELLKMSTINLSAAHYRQQPQLHLLPSAVLENTPEVP